MDITKGSYQQASCLCNSCLFLLARKTLNRISLYNEHLNLNTKKLIDFYKFNQHFHSIYCSNINKIYVGAADSVHDKSKHIKTVQLSFDYNYYSTQQALYTTEILSGCKKFLRSRRLCRRLPCYGFTSKKDEPASPDSC